MQAMKKLEAAGFSRADIARALGVQRQAVGHWARNRNSPSGALTAALIELGKQRGVSFMSQDFIPEKQAS